MFCKRCGRKKLNNYSCDYCEECSEKISKEHIDELNKKIKENPKDANLYFERGKLKYESGDYDGAIADFTKAIKLNPKNPEFYRARGECYQNLVFAGSDKDDYPDYDSAIKDFKEIIKINPKDIDAYIELGWCCWKNGDYEDSTNYYKKALDLDPDNLNLYWEIAENCQSRTEYYKLKLYENFIRRNPDNLEGYEDEKEFIKNALNYVNWYFSDDEEAMYFYSRLIEDYKKLGINDNNDRQSLADAYFNKGNLYYKSDKTKLKAEKNYEKAVELNPELKDEIDFCKAFFDYKNKDFRITEEEFREIYDKEKEKREIINKSYEYFKEKKYEAAYQLLMKYSGKDLYKMDLEYKLAKEFAEILARK